MQYHYTLVEEDKMYRKTFNGPFGFDESDCPTYSGMSMDERLELIRLAITYNLIQKK